MLQVKGRGDWFEKMCVDGRVTLGRFVGLPNHGLTLVPYTHMRVLDVTGLREDRRNLGGILLVALFLVVD